MNKILLLSLFLLPAFTQPVLGKDMLHDDRYCGTPKRNAKGEILRRADVLAAFQKIHPCPSTGKTTGACPGWALDHVWSLASCGCDSVDNLQWLPNEIKSAAGKFPKDRWERKVYQCSQGGVK